jgi:hypothetical protein
VKYHKNNSPAGANAPGNSTPRLTVKNIHHVLMYPVPLFPDHTRSEKERDGSELGCLLETWSAMTCMTLITNSQLGFPVTDDFKSAFDAVHRGFRKPSTQMEGSTER